ncbi:MAG: hypothetical protein G01um101416_4 [Microgenomates group bacterium Gr01-1014_16]|nr:MAG: hypothetical protein G01um101416_4 [Microgenomates group bacterium Gr01-1014_16]
MKGATALTNQNIAGVNFFPAKNLDSQSFTYPVPFLSGGTTSFRVGYIYKFLIILINLIILKNILYFHENQEADFTGFTSVTLRR